jgi:hypothetical protein
VPQEVLINTMDKRRHPVLASPGLALRLYRQGVFR